MLDTNQLFALEHHGHGTLFIGEEPFATGSFRLQRGKYDVSAPFSLDAFLTPAAGLEFTHYDANRDISFRGTISYGADLLIPSLASVRFRTGRPFHLQAEAHEVIIGAERLNYDPDRVQLRAGLTPSEAIAPRFWTETFDDDGRVLGENPTPAQHIETELGTMVVREFYEFEPIRGVTLEGTLRLRRNSAELLVGSGCLTRDILSLLRNFRGWLEDLCTVLSFVGRQRVEWFELFAAVSPGSAAGGPLQDQFDWFRTASGSRSRRFTTPILDAFRMRPNTMAVLLSNFRTHPLRESIRLAIEYLIASNYQSTLEARVVSAFTALESVVNAMGEADRSSYTMTARQFKHLASSVRKIVRDYFARAALDEDTASETCDKVGELYRRPIVPRTVTILEDHAIRWDDLWPTGTNLKEGIGIAYRLRNSLVHAGRISDREQAERIHVRIHTLAERLVFSLLQGEDELLHPYAHSHTRRLGEAF